MRLLLDTDTTIVSWTKLHGIRIPYMFENIQYNYVPDFFIEFISGEKLIEEVKGRIILHDLEKQNACKSYCESNNHRYRMIMGTDINDLQNYKKLLKETKNATFS